MTASLNVLDVYVDLDADTDSPHLPATDREGPISRAAAPRPVSPMTSPAAGNPRGGSNLDGSGFFIGLIVAVPAGLLTYAAAMFWWLW